MSEPHQRSKSGKLRNANRVSIDVETSRKTEKREVRIGIGNATPIYCDKEEDESEVYYQTPTTLSSTQTELLTKMAKGYGITSKYAVDRLWRRTWNIGAWHIGDKLSISINLKQPNIALCWVIIYNSNIEKIKSVCSVYEAYNLESSTCRVIGSNSKTTIQGRWALHALDDLIGQGITTKDNIEITNLNICQVSLYCWVILSNKSKYLCYFTRESIDIIMRYLPDNCMDLNETSSGNSISIKVKSPIVPNDATHLNITDTGGLQYQGRSENITLLPEALSAAIRKAMKSVHVSSLLKSLEYRILPNSEFGNLD